MRYRKNIDAESKPIWILTINTNAKEEKDANMAFPDLTCIALETIGKLMA